MAPAALAQESQADASGERSHGKRSPGNHRRPMHDSMNDQRERNGSGENNGAVKAPANPRGEGDEKIGEPDGDLGGADEQENDERCEVHNQRQMPTALAEKFLGGNDHQSKNEIPEQEDERQIVSADMLELEQIHNRQEDRKSTRLN